ncbi:hypothetical protein ACFPBZ_02750 [Actinomycetospora atypica]|uniref:Uncharacterized protein n=1 Tax=Actinomycetospora atypica TaxID=1290095 RepID=A0ABV9YH30_9PSEU
MDQLSAYSSLVAAAVALVACVVSIYAAIVARGNAKSAESSAESAKSQAHTADRTYRLQARPSFRTTLSVQHSPGGLFWGIDAVRQGVPEKVLWRFKFEASLFSTEPDGHYMRIEGTDGWLHGMSIGVPERVESRFDHLMRSEQPRELTVKYTLSVVEASDPSAVAESAPIWTHQETLRWSPQPMSSIEKPGRS